MNYAYASCIPTSGAGKSVVYGNYTYDWTCLPASYDCVVDADCPGTADAPECCGKVTVDNTTTTMCMTTDMDAMKMTMKNVTGVWYCSNALLT